MNQKILSTEIFGQDQEVVQRRLQNAIELLKSNQQKVVSAAADKVK